MTALGFQRSRSRGQLTKAGTWRWWNYQGSEATGDSVKVGKTETMTDWVQRDFHRRRKSGEVIMNHMTQNVLEVKSGTISSWHAYSSGNPNQWGKTSGNYAWFTCGVGSVGNPPTLPPGSITAADINNARIAASTRVRSQIGRSSTDNWENVAEFDKTVRTLRHPIDSWWAFDRKSSALLGGAKSLASAWLIYRYGIRPLISSVDATLVQLYRNVRPIRVTSRAVEKLSAQTNTTFNVTSGSFIGVVRRNISETYTIRAMSLDQAITDDFHKFGFSSKSLLTLPWELIPYSFVVDWFFNVSDYIGSLANVFQPVSLGQCLVIKSDTTEYRQTVSNTDPTVTIVSPMMDWWQQTSSATTRLPWLDGSGLVVKSDFRLDSPTRIADALALVGQRILSIFGR